MPSLTFEQQKYTVEEIKRLKDICNKASKVVTWYDYGDEDGTVRGPWCRWFKCEEGVVKNRPDSVSDVADDVTFAAEAMNNFLPILLELEKHKHGSN